MEASEQVVNLSPEDIAQLEKLKLETKTGRYWAVGCFGSLILAALFFVTYFVLVVRSFAQPGEMFASPLILISTVAIDAIAVLGAIWIVRYIRKGVCEPKENPQIAKDLAEGQKKVITLQVEEQDTNAHYTNTSGRAITRMASGGEGVDMDFILVLGGKKYRADEDLYMQLRPGDLLEAHITPNACHVLYYKIVSTGVTFPGGALR
jgi:hypothetical protein